MARRPDILEITRGYLVRLATENVAYKLLSLLIALSLWGWIQGEQVREESAWVDVEYVMPAQLVLTQQPAKRLRVTVSGAQAFVKSLRRKDLALTVDLSDLGEGVQTVEFVGEEIVGLPNNVRVVGLVPNSLQVQLETKASKVVPLSARTVGEVAEGYRVTELALVPAALTVEGPTSVLEKLDDMDTEPIDVSGLRAPTQVGVKVLPKRRTVALVGQVPVVAEVNVEPVTAQRTFTAVPVISRSPDWQPELEAVTVVVSGPVLTLQAMQLDGVTVLVVVPDDSPREPLLVSDRSGDGPRFEVKLSGGEGIEVVGVEPGQIRVLPVEAEAEDTP